MLADARLLVQVGLQGMEPHEHFEMNICAYN